MTHKDDYDLSEKIKITFKGMPYYVMPRYRTHYIDNDYEKFSLQILRNNLAEDKVFVDVGAHYGAYSLYAAQSTGSKVIAVEPVHENFQLLNENVRANHLEKLVETHNFAVSDKNGEAEFNIPWASDSAGFYEHPNAETVKKQKVKVRKLDDMLAKTKVDLIKIDTEGHEVSVLKGLEQTLKNNPQAKLIIELNPECLKRAGKSVEVLLAAIAGYDKDIYIVEEDTFTLVRLTDQFENWRSYVAESGYANLYCVPRPASSQYLLFVSHSPRLDGAEMALVDQVCALREKGWLAHVVTPGQGLLQELLIEKGISHSVVEGYSFWVRSEEGVTKDVGERINYLNVRSSAEIAGIAKYIKPTAIVNNTLANPWGYMAAKSLGLPLFWMVHEYGDLDHNLAFRHDVALIRKFIVEESDLVFCCSEAVKKTLLTHDSRLDKKIHTIYNLMNQASIVERSKQKVKSPFSGRSNTFKLCIVGTIKEQKGQIVAIKAVAALKEQKINAELLIIGEGKKRYVAQLRKLVKEQGLDEHIRFLGRKANPYPYMRAADAVIVGSNSEAFGRVAAEAMMIGVPVVGSDAGGTAELIVDGKTGLLYRPSDAGDLTRQLKKLRKTNAAAIIDAAKDRVARLLDVEHNVAIMMRAVTALKPDTTKAAYGKILNEEWSEAIRTFVGTEKLLNGRNQSINQLAAENEALKNSNAALQQALEDVTHSRSWRLTEPLRKSNHMIRKFRG